MTQEEKQEFVGLAVVSKPIKADSMEQAKEEMRNFAYQKVQDDAANKAFELEEVSVAKAKPSDSSTLDEWIDED